MSSSNTKLLAAIALVITFVVGAVIGVVADRIVLMHGGLLRHSPRLVVRHLDHRLHLSDQQRAQVTEIISRHQQRIAGIWSGARPAVQHEIEEANNEIDRILTPEQRATFAKMRMRLMERSSVRGPLGPGRHP